MDILTIVNEKNKQTIYEEFEKLGKVKLLSRFAQILDRRAFVTLDESGKIARKEIPFAVPNFAFFDDKDILVDTILEYSDPKERQNLEAIDRFSNLETEKIKRNLIKTIFHGDIDFSKRYAKELFLRDREQFFKTIANFVGIGESAYLMPLYLLSFDKLCEKYEGNIMYLVISFFTKYRIDTNIYENIDIIPHITVNTIIQKLRDDENKLYSYTGLGIISMLRIIEKFGVSNNDRILSKLMYEFENSKIKPLNELQRKIVDKLL